MSLAIEYGHIVCADCLSPNSVVADVAVVQQITYLTLFQGEGIGRGVSIAILGRSNGLIAADVFVCVQYQTACDGGCIVHGTDNDSFSATGMIVVCHRDVFETTVGDATRATQLSGDSTRLCIVLLVADGDILHAETGHRTSEVGEETYLGSIGRDGAILDGISVTIIVSCKALTSSQGGEGCTLQVNIFYLLDIEIGIFGNLDITFQRFQVFYSFYLVRLAFSTLSQLTYISRNDSGCEVQTIEVVLAISDKFYRHLVFRTHESAYALLSTIRRADKDWTNTADFGGLAIGHNRT